jgi:Uma2 family endonuclease
MVAFRDPSRLTPEEYLSFEKQSESRNEYYDGVLVSMAGASLDHNRAAVDTASALNGLLSGTGCEAFAMDLRVLLSESKYAYPDVVTVCGEPHLVGNEPPTLTNPILICEVPSPSTEAFDRNRKFEYYAAIETFEEYLLISQDRPKVERYHREPGIGQEKWIYEIYSSIDDVICLESISCSLPLSLIYKRVDFQTAREDLQ